MPTIKHLIRCALDEGRTVRDLAHDSNYQVKFQTFQQLSLHPPKQFPKDIKTIDGMAQALRVSRAVIVLAYAESLGVPLENESSTFITRLPSDVDQLDIDMQNALIALARAAVKSAGRAVIADEPQDSNGHPASWLPARKHPGMLGDQDRNERHKRGS